MDLRCTKLTKAQDLVLELDTLGPYQHGDVVRGMLKYKPKAQHSQSIVRSVCLKIWGQIDMRYMEIGGVRTKTYQDHAFLLDHEVDLSEIYDSDSDFDVIREWKFETTLPAHPSSSAADHTWPSASPFLSTSDELPKQKLPSTFVYGKNAGSLAFTHEANIEYALTATVELAEPGEECTVTEQTATLPFRVHNPGSDQPIADFQLKKDIRNVLTRSLQFVLERQETPLTFRERLRTRFNPSKIPQFSCNFSIRHPTIVQLNNPTLPFLVHAEPDFSEATTISPTQIPHLNIASFSLSIKCTTHFRGHSTYHGDHTSSKTDEYTIYNSRRRPNGSKEIDVTLLPNTNTPFDLGAHLGLAVSSKEATCIFDNDHNKTSPLPTPLPSNPRSSSRPSSTPTSSLTSISSSSSSPPRNSSLSISASRSPSRSPSPSPSLHPTTTRFKLPLHPTFSTPSIAQTHLLHWNLTVKVQGTQEFHFIEGSADVRVIAEAKSGVGIGLSECVARKVGGDEKVWAERRVGDGL